MDIYLKTCKPSIISLESSKKLTKWKMPSIPGIGVHSLKSLQYPTRETFLAIKDAGQFQENYIKKISEDLKFSKEVVKDRGLAALSFQEWDAKGIFDPSDFMSHLQRKRPLTCHPHQHKPCHMRHISPLNLKERQRCLSLGKSIWKKSQTAKKTFNNALLLPFDNVKTSVFLTETPEGLSNFKLKRKSDTNSTYDFSNHSSSWDKDPAKMLTKTIGQQLGEDSTDGTGSRDGDWQQTVPKEIVSEEYRTTEDFRMSKQQYKSTTKDDQIQEKERKRETPLPVNYQISNCCPLPKKVLEPGRKNNTAESVSVKHFDLIPPLKLLDRMNPRIRKFAYKTTNTFEGELYSGTSKIIHQKDKKDCIFMESQNQYNKHMQESFPKSYQVWSSKEGDAGAFRWITLPSCVEEEEEIKRNSSSPPPQKTKGHGEEVEKAQNAPLNERKVFQNIVTQWRNAWMLSGSWKNTTTNKLKRDLSSLHNAPKISALITIASAAVDRRQNESKSLDMAPSRAMAIPDVPADMLPLISNALKNDDFLVRMAAALCQYMIREVSAEARSVMISALDNGSDADSWAAAQCLALDGEPTFPVVKRVLTQLFEVRNKETEEQACYVLSHLSKESNLIPALVGETLNSHNWRDRILACRALSQLHQPVNWDLINKLSHLMWDDWHPAVRKEAMNALGKMRQGKEVHDQLRENLESGNWKEKVEALSLIGWLRLMTAQLLPGFLQSFSSDFVAVRKEACVTAALLRIKDEMVLKCLYKLIQMDPIWKIRAHAIKAAGKIGHVTPHLKELLLRALCNKEPAVRMEACHCVAVLQISDAEFHQVLQDRLIYEPEENVKRAVGCTLTALNTDHKWNQETITMIQQQALPRIESKPIKIPKVQIRGSPAASIKEKLTDWSKARLI